MLEKIRENATGVGAKVILGLIILSFVFAGVGGYISSSADVSAAEINGEPILNSTFERAYQSERARMESQLGEAFSQLAANPDYLQTFRQGVLQRLVDEKLVEQKAQELGLRISDTELRDVILNMPEFQVGGQFNKERHDAILIQAGFTAADFRAYMRNQLTRQQLRLAIAASDFALASEAKETLEMQNQTRNARYLELDSAMFESEVVISDQDISDYYQENIASFDTEEKVSVEYVEVKVEDFAASIEVTEGEIALYYEEHQSSYRTEEERRASHILIEFGDDEDVSRDKADSLLAQLNEGADFAELAKTESSDTFSGENGGDLDWIAKGVYGGEFEAAVFGLANIGDISEVVRSESGFHIIKLTDLKPESVKSVDEVKEEIVDILKHDLAVEEYIAVQQTMAELAFEIPDALDEVAEAGKVEVKSVADITRLNPPAPFDDAILMNQAFSEELIDEGVNSDVIEISDERFVILRVTAHEPERTKPQSEVTEEIKQALMAKKSQELALQWMETVKSELSADETVAALIAEKEIDWQSEENIGRYSGEINGQMRTELFKLGAVNDARAVELSNGNVGLVQLLQINNENETDDSELQNTELRLSTNYGQTSFTTLLEAVNEASDITTSI